MAPNAIDEQGEQLTDRPFDALGDTFTDVSRRAVLKTSAATASALALGGMATSTAAARGSDRSNDELAEETAVSTDIVPVPLFVADEAGNPAPFDDPDTELYEIREGNPIRAPNGHHVTWGGFSSVQGLVYADCLDAETVEESGTGVVVLLAGLIPNAVYTIWSLTFEPPGFTGDLDDDLNPHNMTGFGTLGPSDGSQSTFRSTASGLGAIGATTPGGDLSGVGDIEACALDEYEWHVVGAYHRDDRSHGPALGPAGTAVEQFAFVFGDER